MERRSLALLCAAALCFWLFALAFGSAQGAGLRAVRTVDAQSVLAGAVAVSAGAEADAPELPCRAAILVEQESGAVLYEKNADEAVPIASITKLMTLLLAFESVHAGTFTLQTPVTASEHASRMGGSQIWLEPGEQFTLEELFKAICVASANDAAVAVAELVGGSEPAFVEQMNARAQQLGLEHTAYRNACGLDEAGHVSSARDVAALSREILRTCPEVLEYTGIWTESLRGGQTQLVNTNKLLKRYAGITGLKTGTTGAAGVCISATAERGGLKLIAVILGAPSSAERFGAATALLDYGFAHWCAAPVPAPEQRPLQLAVHGGTQAAVPLDYAALPATVLRKKADTGALRAELALPERCEAPVRQGDTLGTVTVTDGTAVLGEYPVRAAADVPQLSFAAALELMRHSLLGA